MTYGDVRGACLALIKSRLGGSAPGGWSQPAALGWKLENASISAAEMSALCAAWIADSNGSHVAAPRRWRPSPALRAFLAEYRNVRLGAAGDPPVARARTVRPRRACTAAERRGVTCDS